MNEEIKKAVNVAKRAQRNYDLSKSIPENAVYAGNPAKIIKQLNR